MWMLIDNNRNVKSVQTICSDTLNKCAKSFVRANEVSKKIVESVMMQTNPIDNNIKMMCVRVVHGLSVSLKLIERYFYDG